MLSKIFSYEFSHVADDNYLMKCVILCMPCAMNLDSIAEIEKKNNFINMACTRIQNKYSANNENIGNYMILFFYLLAILR